MTSGDVATLTAFLADVERRLAAHRATRVRTLEWIVDPDNLDVDASRYALALLHDEIAALGERERWLQRRLRLTREGAR